MNSETKVLLFIYVTIRYNSGLPDKEPKLMSWETVTTVIRSNQLQQVCCEYQSTLTEYEKAKESGDKERERHLKSQLASLKQKCPTIMLYILT